MKKKRDNGLLIRLVAVFLLLGIIVNLVADAVMWELKLNIGTALFILVEGILISILILGDKIADAF